MTKRSDVLRIPAVVTTFGEAIRWARNERGMTLRGLGAAIGVHAAFLCDIEHGRRETARVSDFARALGVHVADLERRQGVTEDLIGWLKVRPDIVRLLRELRGCRCNVRCVPLRGTAGGRILP